MPATPRTPLAASNQDNVGAPPPSTTTASALSKRRASSAGAAAEPIKARRLASSSSAVDGRPTAAAGGGAVQEQVADEAAFDAGAYAGFYSPALIAHANVVRDRVIKGLPTAQRHGLAARIVPKSTSQETTVAVVVPGHTARGHVGSAPSLRSNALRLNEDGKIALPARIVAQRRYPLPRPSLSAAVPTSTGSVSAATGPPTEPSPAGNATASSSARASAIATAATPTQRSATADSGASPVLNTTAAPLESVIAPLLVDGPWTVLRELEREALDALRARDEREATFKQADVDDGSRLLAVINARLDESAFPHPPLRREGVVFSTIQACEETRAFLLHLVDKPFVEPPVTPATPIVTGDPLNDRDAPANELSESSDGLARFYARFVTFESLEHALEFMRRYASDHYADLAWASTIISGLLSLKDKEPGHASNVALSYGGYTIANSISGRLVDDLAIEQSRMTNLLALRKKMAASAPSRLHARELVSFRTAANDDLDANAAHIADREVAIIAACRSFSTNSARGGRRLEVVESAFSRQHAFLAAAGARQEDLDRLALPERSLTDTQQQIQHAVRRHFDDMLTFWQSEVDPSEAGETIDVGTEGGRRAFAAIKQAATSFSRRGALASGEETSTDVFVVGKDVTRSSLVGREAFFGPRASRGGHAGYVIARGVLQEPVDEVLGWIALIAYVDLWSIQLRHKLVRIAIVFVARLLALVKPTILVTHSSKLSSIVRRGMIGAAIGTVDTPERRAFLGVQTRTTRTLLEHVAPPAEHKWKELWAKDWLASVGTLEVVEGPLGVEMLHLDQIDCGFIKYYPAVQDLVVRLAAIIEVKLQITRKVHLEHRLAGCINLEQIKRSVDQICEDIGLAIELDEARHRLGQRFGALRSAQSTSAVLRSSSVVFDGPPLAEDAIADAVKLLAISSSSPSTSSTAGGSNPAAIDDSDLLSSAPRVAQLVSVRSNQTSLPSDFATMCMLATSDDFARWFLVQAQGESLAVAARSEMRRREQLEIQARKRQEIGTTIAGAIGIRQCVERLREDANNSTQKERFELQIDACITCGQWWIHIRDDAKIGIADHDCTGKRKIYYTRILWTSTLALLLNLDLDEMASYGVKYDKTTARQRLPSRFRDSALPAAGNPPCILPTNSLQSHATSAAVDALVVSAAIRGCQTVAARVQALDLRRSTAWSGNGSKKSQSALVQALRARNAVQKCVCATCGVEAPGVVGSRKNHACTDNPKKFYTVSECTAPPPSSDLSFFDPSYNREILFDAGHEDGNSDTLRMLLEWRAS